jgi:hypothetical protein
LKPGSTQPYALVTAVSVQWLGLEALELTGGVTA